MKDSQMKQEEQKYEDAAPRREVIQKLFAWHQALTDNPVQSFDALVDQRNPAALAS